MSSSLARGGSQVPGPSGNAARVLVAGDTHGNLEWVATLSKLAARFGCAGVLQLGDFGFWPDARQARQGVVALDERWVDGVAERAARFGVWWRVVDGNHDAHPLVRAAYPADGDGVRPIRSGVLDWADRGAVWQWCGLRFGALGGAESSDPDGRTEGSSWWATESITDADVQSLAGRAGAAGVDVLACHDAPYAPGRKFGQDDPAVAARFERSAALLRTACAAVRPRLLLHGHWHMRYTAQRQEAWGELRIEGLASDCERNRFRHPWMVLDLPSLQELR